MWWPTIRRLAIESSRIGPTASVIGRFCVGFSFRRRRRRLDSSRERSNTIYAKQQPPQQQKIQIKYYYNSFIPLSSINSLFLPTFLREIKLFIAPSSFCNTNKIANNEISADIFIPKNQRSDSIMSDPLWYGDWRHSEETNI